MSGAYSRNKGARAERELCALLSDFLGTDFNRNLKQCQQAQHGDIEQLVGPYLVEAKNHEQIRLQPWWAQACEAAKVRGAVPCLAYRLSNRSLADRWRFIVPEWWAWATGQAWAWDFRYTKEVGIDAFAGNVRGERG